MTTNNPIPTGQCRKCKHAQILPYTEHPEQWLRLCKAVDDIEPKCAMTEEFAVQLEASLIRLAYHNDCPDFASNE